MNSIYDTPEYKERWAMYQSALSAFLIFYTCPETTRFATSEITILGYLMQKDKKKHKKIC